MANENKLTTLAQMQEFAKRQDSRDDQQEEQSQQLKDNNTQLANRVSTIEGNYLKNEDITALSSSKIDTAWNNA